VTDTLVVIDMQKGMFGIPDYQPFDGDGVVSRISKLIERARNSNTPVIFIQHKGEDEHPLSPKGEGYAICPELSPRSQETIIVKDRCNAFSATNLHEHLQKIGSNKLIVCGMQTEYCVDTFVRAAHEREYEITLVEDGHTTFDTETLGAAEILKHHNDTLRDAFALVMKTQDIKFSI